MYMRSSDYYLSKKDECEGEEAIKDTNTLS